MSNRNGTANISCMGYSCRLADGPGPKARGEAVPLVTTSPYCVILAAEYLVHDTKFLIEAAIANIGHFILEVAVELPEEILVRG